MKRFLTSFIALVTLVWAWPLLSTTKASGPAPTCYTSPNRACPGPPAAFGPARNSAVISTSASSTAQANAALERSRYQYFVMILFSLFLDPESVFA